MPVKSATNRNLPAPAGQDKPLVLPKGAKVDLGEKVDYRVLRPIQHGSRRLVIGDLVSMHPQKAAALVRTKALAKHIIPETVSRVIDADTGEARVQGATVTTDAELEVARAAAVAASTETDPTKIEALQAEEAAARRAANPETV